MQIKCEWCGSLIDDKCAECPNCSGVNYNMQRSVIGVPQTIEELIKWCNQNNMPLERMRFFIGQDYRGAKSFWHLQG